MRELSLLEGTQILRGMDVVFSVNLGPGEDSQYRSIINRPHGSLLMGTVVTLSHYPIASS